ncbi:dual oxidase maturation factor 1 [Rhipicephalus sanguineus]|uniref:dual oxidase maturation factor 1 n=1 Tax=Rhipicephalus sanguineus TaxID=34632 RepID=UPI0020C51214|nr:dual oxidase maturation factor 1 [Rhipicephalus sanguineus]
MLKGWFDAFRTEGGPTLYAYSNRTAVTEDIRNIVIYVCFSTLFIAFIIVFPGIRKEKLSTFVSVTISLLVGAVVLTCIYGSDWHVASAVVSSPYRAFSADRISARIGVHIGLNSVNITLRAMPRYSEKEEINFNERFTWRRPTQVKEDYREALVKGLPFPILTIAEYFSQDMEGFCWGRRYRLAGHYTFVLLGTSLALWLLMNVLLCAVPRYGAYAMQLTGLVMLLSGALYSSLLPARPLVIPFEGGLLTFNFGWCYWAVLGAGTAAAICGLSIAVLDIFFPRKFSTILDVDYDTPYRHVVGQESMVRSTAASSPKAFRVGIPALTVPTGVCRQGGPTQQLATVCASCSSHTMIGFHPRLSTRDTMLQLPHQVASSSAASGSRTGIVNTAYEDSEEVHEMRAVSLHNFGKERQRSSAPTRCAIQLHGNDIERCKHRPAVGGHVVTR